MLDVRWVAVMGIFAVALGGEREAVAQRGPGKTLRIQGPGPTGVTVEGAAPIGRVLVSVRQSGGALLTVEAIGQCSMQFPSVSDAAAMQARILDPKTTSVECQGAVTTTARPPWGNIHSIAAATSLTVIATP